MLQRFVAVSQQRLISARGFHAGKPAQSSVLEADSGKSLTRFYHTSSLALAGLTPIAFVLSPSILNYPVDILLGALIPLHAHMGMNYVISDYVPKAGRTLARTGMLGLTIVAAAGILKLNLTGPGLTETLKAMWRSKAKPSSSSH